MRKLSFKSIISLIIAVLLSAVSSCSVSLSSPKEILQEKGAKFSVHFPDEWDCLYKSKPEEFAWDRVLLYFALDVTDEQNVFFDDFITEKNEDLQSQFLYYIQRVNLIQDQLEEVQIPTEYLPDFESEYAWKAVVIGQLRDETEKKPHELFYNYDAFQIDRIYVSKILYMVYNQQNKTLLIVYF
ncbi:MAG: hypothetical protein IJ811_03620 [Clostridia bacterium]|nr:hypothetical protein [Clostridia bacterium]